MQKYLNGSAPLISPPLFNRRLQINKCAGLIDRWWKGRDRTICSDTPYRYCFVEWECQRIVLRLNT